MSKNLEIERKFIVNPKHPDWLAIKNTQKGKRLTQTTIHKEEGYKLRIRIIEDLESGERSSFFTFKVSKKWGAGDPAIRDEYEWPVADRTALYMMIGHGEISKIRRSYRHSDGLIYEIDEYEGKNAGIITADVELSGRKETLKKPTFLGWEVTDDNRLKNSTLQHDSKSFQQWPKELQLWYQTLFVGNGVSAYSEKASTKVQRTPKKRNIKTKK